MNTDTTPHLRESDKAINAMQAAMHVLFVVLLAVGFIRSLSSGAGVAPVIAVTVVFVAVYLAGLLIDRRSRARLRTKGTHERDKRSEALGQAWILALVIGWMALLAVSANFVWLAFALYFLILHVTRRPMNVILTIAVLAASIFVLMTGQHARPGLVVGPIMGMLVALGISWVYSQLRAENEARRHLLSQLTLNRDDLLAAQEELARTQHDAGALAERTRLARDIHDTLAQSFSSILLLSRAGLVRDGANDTLTQIESLAANGLNDAREVVHALRPSELEEAPLATAIERLAQRLAEQSHIHMRMTTEGQPRTLSTTLDVALLRVTQSALANIRLHSQATRANITLTYEPVAVRLEIIDDGVGFTPSYLETAPERGSGFGINAMRSRLTELGGTLKIESAPGDGTALIATVPTRGETSADKASA